MTKVKQKKVYTYDFPENRELAEGLHQGDLTLIAQITGYTIQHVSYSFKGTRRMPDSVRQAAEVIIKANREKDALVAAL